MIQVGSVGDLAALIRSERRRQGITQVDLAGLSGVGVTFLSQLENGKESAELGKVLNVVTMLGIDLIAEPRS